MASATPKETRSSAVILAILHASCSFEASFQRILANPLGEITEYIAFYSIASSSQTPIANAPPLSPSPRTIEIIGVLRVINSAILRAIASP